MSIGSANPFPGPVRAQVGRSECLLSPTAAEPGCDYLVILVDSRVQVAGDIDELLATHHRLTGPRRDRNALPGDQQVIVESHTDRQSTFVVRTDDSVLDPSWSVEQLGLEDLVLAYMARGVERNRRPVLKVRS